MALHSRRIEAGLRQQATARGQMSYQAGLSAEDRVAAHFEAQGYDILARRWRAGRGELDVVLAHGAGIICVEVKQSRDFDRALAQITPAKLQRLYQTAEVFIGTLPTGSLTEVRFDAALVNAMGEIRIVENIGLGAS